jgi:hypothetical protein
MTGRSAAGAIRQESTAIHELVKNEIHTLKEQQRSLRAQGRTGYVTIIILIACIFVNCAFLATVKDYPSLFIAASFYLYMIYFITLLLPLGKGARSLPFDRVRQFFTTLHHTGIIPATDRLTRIFLDAFFINSRALCGGFLLIFSCDLIFAAIGFYQRAFSSTALIIILFQSLAILIFYFLVWKFEPYSTWFWDEIGELKGRFAQKRVPPSIITLMFGTAALLVLFVILSAIILLPGFTVKTLLTITGLEQLGDLVILIGTLVSSQYFIVRFFHGISSEQMAAYLSETKITRLQSTRIGSGAGLSQPTGFHETTAGMSADDRREAAGTLLESKIYQLELRTVFGAFPVYIVNPDFSVILDDQVLAVITGYLRNAENF